MKTKFESNVANETPKTKVKEPGLPWKLDNDDLDKIKPQNGKFSTAGIKSPPLKARAIFMVMLIVGIFMASIYLIFNATMQNENMRTGLFEKEKEMSLLQQDLEKLNTEKAVLNKDSAKLEKQVNDLSAQKELFTAVIESLTKEEDEIE